MTNGTTMTNVVIECILSRSAAKYYDPAASLICSAPLIFARRVGGIDSITEGHSTIDFRRSIFAHLQRNSENDDIPHIGR